MYDFIKRYAEFRMINLVEQALQVNQWLNSMRVKHRENPYLF
jgi:hypothetical protein